MKRLESTIRRIAGSPPNRLTLYAPRTLSLVPNRVTLHFYYFMKKLLILALGAASLGLGACNRSSCPAYTSAKTTAAPVTASTATPIVRQ